ncbi:transcriptional repressor [Mycobacterium helveticum]|uniref:Transcriptional repressor n=1 Tax=Mycobacterium helveticum TaxID=2592811 RepID=A0A557XRK3_9MYCO|nr:transcriptional repressor [Mycobacterium helveticum]TVS88556.1 transcriptional repressor [Mycobacterium helveticum]
MQAACRSGRAPPPAELAVPGVGSNTGRVTCKQSVLDPAVTERIGDFLRARGLRRMASRIQVLAVLEPVHGHLPVADIHHRVRGCVPPGAQAPDVATIYRTVTTLVDQGVLHALTLDSGVTTYGLATAPHHHAVCTQCGAIIEVPARQLSSALEQAMVGSSFELSERAGLTLRGLCPQCQAGEPGPRPRGRARR